MHPSVDLTSQEPYLASPGQNLELAASYKRVTYSCICFMCRLHYAFDRAGR